MRRLYHEDYRNSTNPLVLAVPIGYMAATERTLLIMKRNLILAFSLLCFCAALGNEPKSRLRFDPPQGSLRPGKWEIPLNFEDRMEILNRAIRNSEFHQKLQLSALLVALGIFSAASEITFLHLFTPEDFGRHPPVFLWAIGGLVTAAKGVGHLLLSSNEVRLTTRYLADERMGRNILMGFDEHLRMFARFLTEDGMRLLPPAFQKFIGDVSYKYTFADLLHDLHVESWSPEDFLSARESLAPFWQHFFKDPRAKSWGDGTLAYFEKLENYQGFFSKKLILPGTQIQSQEKLEVCKRVLSLMPITPSDYFLPQ
jgi:hypothetical protein